MSATLSPIAGAGWQYFDNQGDPLNGGLLYTYLAGSTTPQATWTASTQGVQNANPIVLDSAGRPPSEVWLQADLPYKFVLKTSAGVTLGTWDNVQGFVTSSTNSVSEWVGSGLTPTYVSTSSFTVAGNQTAIFETNRRVQWFTASGTFYGYVSSSSYSSGTGLTTVNVTADSTVLDATLQTINYAVLDATNPSVPQQYAKTGTAASFTTVTATTVTATNLNSGNVALTGGTITGITGFSVPDYLLKNLGVI